MRNKRYREYTQRLAPIVVGALLPMTAWATNGYYAPGYSPSQDALGGAGAALVEDAMVVTLNPAGGVWAGTQLDFSFSLFDPHRYYSASDRGPNAGTGVFTIGPTDGALRSNNEHFYIPGLAYNYQLSDRASIGVAMYGNGGLNTKYNGNTATFGQNLPGFQAQCEGTFGGGPPVPGTQDRAGFCGNGVSIAGVDLIQLFITPFYSHKIGDSASIGIAPIFAIQRFKSSGLAAFAKFSNQPDKVTDNGYDYSVGGGVRVGFLWDIVHGVGIGASYQSRVLMTKFRKYAGLFAGGGAFDIPSSFNIGLQLHPVHGHRLVFGFQRINYHEVRSVGNDFNPNDFVNNCAVPRLEFRVSGGQSGSNAPSPSCLGAANGPGFGWRDMIVYKFGYQFHYRDLKLRVGYSFGRQPIPSSQVLFNVLAPGVIERHITGGLAYRLTHALTLEFAYIYAFSHSVVGKNPLSNAPAQFQQNGSFSFDAGPDPQDQNIRINMRQFQATFGFSYRFD